MNPKQTAPLIASLAPLAPAIAPVIPVLIIGGAAFLVLNWLFSNDDKEKKPETVPPSQPETPRNLLETTASRPIPAESSAKPIAVPIPAAPRAVATPSAVPIAPKIPVPAVVSASASVSTPAPHTPPPLPLPIKKKLVTREDMATVFQRGARTLNRTAAVAALKKLGFGKTAAYSALTPDGRFSAWLQIAPDGIIAWTDGQKK